MDIELLKNSLESISASDSKIKGIGKEIETKLFKFLK
jgi:hypothetical protein